MKSKICINMLILLLTLSSSCQTTKIITFKSIQNDLVDFLIKKGDIMKHQVDDFKNGVSYIHVFGLKNNHNQGDLKPGIYSFYSGYSHTRTYFLIIENNNLTILDLSNREGVDLAIKNTLDFCERQNYCSEIIEDYITKIIDVYNVINLHPLTREDPNCKTIMNTKDLP